MGVTGKRDYKIDNNIFRERLADILFKEMEKRIGIVLSQPFSGFVPVTSYSINAYCCVTLFIELHKSVYQAHAYHPGSTCNKYRLPFQCLNSFDSKDKIQILLI